MEQEPNPQPVKLTPRQTQVLGLLLEGMTNKQIAGELGICTRTMELHRKAIMTAFGARSGVELGAMVLKGQNTETVYYKGMKIEGIGVC